MLYDPVKAKDEIVHWIQNYFIENGNGCTAVVGISGGKDSSVVVALCAEALGHERVLGVMMPNGVQSDIADARRVVSCLQIASITINIQDAYNILRNRIQAAMSYRGSNQADINLAPRLRMSTLYYIAQSQKNGGRVANTCNLSEDFVGYSTKFGDSAGDFAPIADLLVHEVKQIGYVLGLPDDLVDKTPADGLCGKSDEDNLGFTYNMLDNYILNGTSGSPSVDVKIKKMYARNRHKVNPMPFFDITSAGMRYKHMVSNQ